MRILFIQDLGINESLALTELSAFLKSKGHICDLLIEKNERNLWESIRKFTPDIFIIPWDIGALSWILKIADKIKKNFAKPIVFCGTYPSFYSHVAIDCPGVEIICIGESEYAILELVERLEKKEDISDIKNLWVKRDGKIYRNELRTFIADLDTLPLPDRGVYYKYRYLKEFSLKRFISGRGCNNSCSFCYNPLLRLRYVGKGNYVRRKSITRIIQEIEDVQKQSILRSVHFSDDIFISNKDWLREFSREYKKINLPFTCNASAELINEEVIELLKTAHCTGIAMGIETGNENLRNLILNKKITNRQIIEAARLIKKFGLFLATFNMIALPGEVIKDVFDTVQLNNKIKVDQVRLSFAFPLPGTELAEYGLKKGFFDKGHIERLLDNTIFPKNAILKSKYKNQFESLFYLFRFGVKFPVSIPFIKMIITLPPIKILSSLNSLVNFYYERIFFNITWYSGIKYILHAGNLEKRTKVFNNYLP